MILLNFLIRLRKQLKIQVDNYSRNIKLQMQDLKIVSRKFLKQVELALYLTDKKFWRNLKSYAKNRKKEPTVFIWLG